MPAPATILVGTDGSLTAMAALRWATDLGRAVGARVHVMHCVASPDGGVADQNGTRQAAEDALRTWCETGGSEAVYETTTVSEGDPRERIVERAAEIDADLVVVGTRGEGGFERLGMGRVASHVVHHADRPVAVVPHASPHVHGAPIVVGLDGSAANRRAVDWSLDVASAVEGPVEAVFVHDPMADSYPHGPASNWKYRGQGEAERLLASAIAEADGEPRVRFQNRGGNIVETLGQVASEVDASMIVVGTRGHWGFSGRVLGHVPTQLPHHSPCAIVVVPHR